MGDQVKHFSLFSMSKDDLQTRLDTARQHAPEIGLMFQWSIEDTRVESVDEILINTNVFPAILAKSPFSRRTDPAAAKADLCQPIVIGAFGFTPPHMGYSAHLADASCLEPDEKGSTAFPADGVTGAACRNRKPDLFFKYTAIHELGHTFGLCHVDGFLRIMYPGQEKSWWRWWLLWRWLTSGFEASFILDEGKKVWDYIVENFAPECLETRQF